MRSGSAALHYVSVCMDPGSRQARGTRGKAVRIGHGPATVSGGLCSFTRRQDSRVKPLPARNGMGWEGEAGPVSAPRVRRPAWASRGHIASTAIRVPPHTLREKEWEELAPPSSRVRGAIVFCGACGMRKLFSEKSKRPCGGRRVRRRVQTLCRNEVPRASWLSALLYYPQVRSPRAW